MVVRQRAAVGPSRREQADVVRMHAVVDALAWPGRTARGDRGLEVDDPQVGPARIEFGQRGTPAIAGVNRRGDRPADPLGQPHIVARVAHPGLVEARVAMPQLDLVDAAPAHHVAGQPERDAIPVGDLLVLHG